MRAEKKYLVAETGEHLDKSEYVFFANYERITVAETMELRGSLAEEEAEFHVVKNSVMSVLVREGKLPDISDWLEGPTAIIVGGDNPPGVAKALRTFYRSREKVEIKGGVLENRLLQPEEIETLATLPSREILKAQFLGLCNAPAEQTVRVLQAAAQGFLNVLQARGEKVEGG